MVAQRLVSSSPEQALDLLQQRAEDRPQPNAADGVLPFESSAICATLIMASDVPPQARQPRHGRRVLGPRDAPLHRSRPRSGFVGEGRAMPTTSRAPLESACSMTARERKPPVTISGMSTAARALRA
ncbi:MAG: hypothetical protein IPN77_24805 [Sandaracinaceae bacterium]|nr:hypothetical protein [Sandaracinaceae bacterium]